MALNELTFPLPIIVYNLMDLKLEQEVLKFTCIFTSFDDSVVTTMHIRLLISSNQILFDLNCYFYHYFNYF